MDLEVGTILIQHLFVLMIAAITGSLISWIAWKVGYYRFPSPIQTSSLSWTYVLMAFAIFLTIELIIIPTLYLVWTSFATGQPILTELLELQNDVQGLDEQKGTEMNGWLNIIGMVTVAFAIFSYYFGLPAILREEVWGTAAPIKPEKKYFPIRNAVTNFLLGSLTWLIAFPWIVVLSQIIGILQDFTYKGPHIDQLAVQHLLDAMDHPMLLWASIAAIVILVPCLEELIFRGFLQTWLKTIYGRKYAIIMTSFLFASFHFASSQGMQNIELLSSLFLLSCFLGFLRERQESLWASIGLHSTFNFLSIVFIFITSEL